VSVFSLCLTLQLWEEEFAPWKAVVVCYPKNHEQKVAGTALWSVGESENGQTTYKRGKKGENWVKQEK